MSLRGDGRTRCYDCGHGIEPDHGGTPGVCKRCDGIEVCVSCGCDYRCDDAGEHGRCAQCDLCESGGVA